MFAKKYTAVRFLEFIKPFFFLVVVVVVDNTYKLILDKLTKENEI